MGGGSAKLRLSQKVKNELFCWHFMKKSENKKAHFLGFGGNFAIVSRRQNMSFFLQLSLKRYYQLTTGTYKNELQSL